MVRIIQRQAEDLKDPEWDLLEATLGPNHLTVVQALRRANNSPYPASELFDAKHANQKGQEAINNILRLQGVAYRLNRIGSWKFEANRLHRNIAFVRWTPETAKCLRDAPCPDPRLRQAITLGRRAVAELLN